MSVRELRWLKASECLSLQARTDAALGAWRDDWGARTAAGVACLPAWRDQALRALDWLEERDGALRFWWHASPGFDDALCAALFDPFTAHGCKVRASAIAAGVVRRARQALRDACIAGLRPPALDVAGGAAAEPPLARQFSPSAGAACLRVELGGQALTLLLPAAALPPPARAVPACATPLQSAHAALGAQRVRLAVEAGSVELTLERLHGLRPGDVITLPARIEAPLFLTGPVSNQPVCRVHLGRKGALKAIELSEVLK